MRGFFKDFVPLKQKDHIKRQQYKNYDNRNSQNIFENQAILFTLIFFWQ